MSKIQIEQTADSVVVRSPLFRYRFSRDTAGFPSEIGFADGLKVFESNHPLLSAVVDGRAVSPSLRQAFTPTVSFDGECARVLFNNILWEDEDGKSLDGYRLALYYEIHDDGVVFARTFFYTETLTPGIISEFALSLGVNMPDGYDANWAYWEFLPTTNATVIQARKGFHRNLPAGEDRRCDGRILPFVSFDFGKSGRRDLHTEFFVEAFNALIGSEIRNTQTDITWNEQGASVTWDFQKEALTNPGRPYQWRNTWGWSLTRFPVERKHPPLRLVHYLDGFEHFPSEDTIREAADEGANLFILHECWRLDLKNGEFPYDEARLKETIDTIHKYGMRAALYVRGNEEIMRYDFAAPLRSYLKKDWDGIYMDYGSPSCFMGLDEDAQGGRIQFREYHTMVSRIREFVGEDGILMSHSGSFFAALAHTKVDGYVSGEQEKGQLICNSTLHAYYGGLSIAPSSLWTAAFPTYRTKAAVPYLAATAQIPFVTVGTQMWTSSLQHPKSPSLINFQRPLWRLWELMDGVKDVRVYTRQNTDNVFGTDSDTGVCLIADKQGNILLLATNFSNEKRTVRLEVDWQALGIKPGNTCIELSAGYDANSWRSSSIEEMTQSVDGFGVSGWLIVSDSEAWRKQLERFTRPYPSSPQREDEYLSEIENIRKGRYDSDAWGECYLKVEIPNYPNNYEESLWWDLFDNFVQLQDVTEPDTPRVLGWLGKDGLLSGAGASPECLVPGVPTAWIPLHEVLAASGVTGERTLALVTKRGDGDFYSFVEGILSPVAGPSTESRKLVYTNAMDSDWSVLSFNVRLGQK